MRMRKKAGTGLHAATTIGRAKRVTECHEVCSVRIWRTRSSCVVAGGSVRMGVLGVLCGFHVHIIVFHVVCSHICGQDNMFRLFGASAGAPAYFDLLNKQRVPYTGAGLSYLRG